jgi:hypothetical protein
VGGGLPPLEAGGSPVDSRLVASDALVEQSDLGGDVGLPALVGVDLARCPCRGLLVCGVTIPPASGL